MLLFNAWKFSNGCTKTQSSFCYLLCPKKSGVQNETKMHYINILSFAMNGLELVTVFRLCARSHAHKASLLHFFFLSFKLHFLPSSYWREMSQSPIPIQYQVKLKWVTLELKLAVRWQKMTDSLWLCGTEKYLFMPSTFIFDYTTV